MYNQIVPLSLHPTHQLCPRYARYLGRNSNFPPSIIIVCVCVSVCSWCVGWTGGELDGNVFLWPPPSQRHPESQESAHLLRPGRRSVFSLYTLLQTQYSLVSFLHTFSIFSLWVSILVWTTCMLLSVLLLKGSILLCTTSVNFHWKAVFSCALLVYYQDVTY